MLHGTLLLAAETARLTLCFTVLYVFMLLSDAVYPESPAKCACTFHPVATVVGDAPFAVKVPSVFVATSWILSAPVPSNVMVLPPIPALLDASASLPVTVTSLPHGTFVIELSVRTVGLVV